MRAVSKFFTAGILIAAVGGGAYYYLNRKAAAPPPPRNPVQTVKTVLATTTSIPIVVRTNGYVAAIDSIDVRPQVQNVIRQVHVKEGQDVQRGQLLFTLDERSDAANLAKVRAQSGAGRAELAEAESTLRRNQDLFAKGFVAQALVDTARSRVDALRGTIAADQAAVQGGQVALGFNRITAGIGGRLGAINVHPGSLAQPGGLPLVTIARIDPVTVSFAVPESHLSAIRSSYPKGDAPVTVQIPDGKELIGKLSFIDNAVDSSTGTIRMKAEFANPDKLLWPGAFVSVSLIARTLANVVTLPPQAIVTGPDDKFVYVVQPDDTVKRQKVEVSVIENGVAAINGVAAGAKVVVEGAQNLRPNGKVKEAGAGGAKVEGGRQSGGAPGSASGGAPGSASGKPAAQ